MKFRIILEEGELTVITQDGGIACMREAEPVDTPIVAVTDYYYDKLTDTTITKDNVFEVLAEGKMVCSDWTILKFNNPVLVTDALSWLNPEIKDWELVDDLFVEIFGPF